VTFVTRLEIGSHAEGRDCSESLRRLLCGDYLLGRASGGIPDFVSSLHRTGGTRFRLASNNRVTGGKKCSEGFSDLVVEFVNDAQLRTLSSMIWFSGRKFR
jgi:hypothetical protein